MRLIAVLLLLACADPTSAESAAADVETVRLVRIADGDTITVRAPRGHDEKIRLMGIDAPEMNYGKGRPDCAAREATRALDLLIGNHPLRLERFGKDTYGRTLAYVWVDSPNGPSAKTTVNEWLLREGHAELFRIARHPQRAAFERAQRQAKTAKKGMWRCR